MKKILQYLIITFAITYLFWGFDIILSIAGMYDHPSYNIGIIFYIIAACSPAIAVYFIMQRDPDKKGIRCFFKSSFTFARPLTELLLIAVFTAVRFVIPFLFGETVMIGDMWQVIVYTPVMLLFGGLEEIGWRGFLQTRLEEKIGSFAGTVLNWAIWLVWHIPLCFINGTYQHSASYFWFAVSLIGSAFSLAALHKVKGSILPCIIFHALGNAVTSYGISVSEGTGMVVSTCVQIISATVIFIVCDRRKRKDKTS
ncbi:MAG: CPBP family intramembrane metalloprotease [Ruminiclostridium sp.]|nr:CPBP family intramembrane metalloprotease [Ruminiclostridium sp.]